MIASEKRANAARFSFTVSHAQTSKPVEVFAAEPSRLAARKKASLLSGKREGREREKTEAQERTTKGEHRTKRRRKGEKRRQKGWNREENARRD